MNEYKAVYTVRGMLQAMAIRFGLEQAGISSRVANSRDAYTILVPAAQLYNAEGVLYPFGRNADMLVTARR